MTDKRIVCFSWRHLRAVALKKNIAVKPNIFNPIFCGGDAVFRRANFILFRKIFAFGILSALIRLRIFTDGILKEVLGFFKLSLFLASCGCEFPQAFDLVKDLIKHVAVVLCKVVDKVLVAEDVVSNKVGGQLFAYIRFYALVRLLKRFHSPVVIVLRLGVIDQSLLHSLVVGTHLLDHVGQLMTYNEIQGFGRVDVDGDSIAGDVTVYDSAVYSKARLLDALGGGEIDVDAGSRCDFCKQIHHFMGSPSVVQNTTVDGTLHNLSLLLVIFRQIRLKLLTAFRSLVVALDQIVVGANNLSALRVCLREHFLNFLGELGLCGVALGFLACFLQLGFDLLQLSAKLLATVDLLSRHFARLHLIQLVEFGSHRLRLLNDGLFICNRIGVCLGGFAAESGLNGVGVKVSTRQFFHDLIVYLVFLSRIQLLSAFFSICNTLLVFMFEYGFLVCCQACGRISVPNGRIHRIEATTNATESRASDECIERILFGKQFSKFFIVCVGNHLTDCPHQPGQHFFATFSCDIYAQFQCRSHDSVGNTSCNFLCQRIVKRRAAKLNTARNLLRQDFRSCGNKTTQACLGVCGILIKRVIDLSAKTCYARCNKPRNASGLQSNRSKQLTARLQNSLGFFAQDAVIAVNPKSGWISPSHNLFGYGFFVIQILGDKFLCSFLEIIREQAADSTDSKRACINSSLSHAEDSSENVFLDVFRRSCNSFPNVPELVAIVKSGWFLKVCCIFIRSYNGSNVAIGELFLFLKHPGRKDWILGN